MYRMEKPHSISMLFTLEIISLCYPNSCDFWEDCLENEKEIERERERETSGRIVWGERESSCPLFKSHASIKYKISIVFGRKEKKQRDKKKENFYRKPYVLFHFDQKNLVYLEISRELLELYFFYYNKP